LVEARKRVIQAAVVVEGAIGAPDLVNERLADAELERVHGIRGIVVEVIHLRRKREKRRERRESELRVN